MRVVLQTVSLLTTTPLAAFEPKTFQTRLQCTPRIYGCLDIVEAAKYEDCLEASYPADYEMLRIDTGDQGQLS